MRIRKNLLSTLLAFVLCFTMFIGVAKSKTNCVHSVYANEEAVVVGVSLPSQQGDYMTNINNCLSSTFVNRDFEVSILYAQDNSANQIGQIYNLIVLGVDVIVVMPVDGDALADIINTASDEGITVIVIGRRNTSYRSAIYVDFDYASVAEDAMNDFLNNYYTQTGTTKVLLFSCNDEHGNVYFDAAKAILINYTGIVRVEYRLNNVFEAYTYAQNWLSSNPSLPNAIFNCCDPVAQKVKEALEDEGYTFTTGGIPVYGFGTYCSHDYQSIATLIADLIQGIISGEISPVAGEIFLVDICHCGGANAGNEGNN